MQENRKYRISLEYITRNVVSSPFCLIKNYIHLYDRGCRKQHLSLPPTPRKKNRNEKKKKDAAMTRKSNPLLSHNKLRMVI